MKGFFSDITGGSLLSQGTSLVTGLMSGLFQKKAQNRAIKAQAEENEKTRQYNLQLANMQNQWNIDQWNRENEYNLPSEQKSRLMQAGLNSDLMYSNGASGLVSASSPEMTSGAPSTPQDMSLLADSPASKGIDDALKVAQINNINADTKKKGGEVQQLNENVLLTRYERQMKAIDLGKHKDIVEYQFKQLKNTVDFADETFQDAKSIIQSQALSAGVKAHVDVKNEQDLINQVVDQCRITHSEAEYYVRTLEARVNKALNEGTLSSLTLNDLTDQYEFNKKAREADEGVDDLLKSLQGGNSFVNAIIVFFRWFIRHNRFTK